MEYRVLGKTGIRVSAVSLGTEYLIDRPREQVIAVIREAIARGVNYFDLFFAQPGFRDIMGEAFTGHRDEVMLAAHLGAAYDEASGQYERIRDPERCESLFLDFLERYHTDYVDVIMLHNSDGQEDYDALMAPGGLCEVAHQLVREGKARWVGFSGHTVSTARQAVESGAIDLLMFPLNLASHAVEGRDGLLRSCVAQGVAMVAMKPYAGGKLLQGQGAVELANVHLGGKDAIMVNPDDITPARCLSYVLAQPGVSTIVPGCQNLDELNAALAVFKSDAEARDFSGVLTGFQQYHPGQCTYCNHCLPCPAGIDIGHTNRMGDLAAGGVTEALRAEYDAMDVAAKDCLQCGTCEERCPFGVPVIDRMEATAELFA